MMYVIFGIGDNVSTVLIEDQGQDFKKLLEMWGLKQTPIHSAGRVQIGDGGFEINTEVQELNFPRSQDRESRDRRILTKLLFTKSLREKLNV